jgi:hypothetical protein
MPACDQGSMIGESSQSVDSQAFLPAFHSRFAEGDNAKKQAFDAWKTLHLDAETLHFGLQTLHFDAEMPHFGVGKPHCDAEMEPFASPRRPFYPIPSLNTRHA